MDMKTKNNPEDTSSKEQKFEITLPNQWNELSDSQLQYFFHQMSRDLPMEEILTLCLFKWAELRILCKAHNGSYLIKRRKSPKLEAMLTLRQIQAATNTLNYLAQCPSFPTRITKIRNANAIEADFQGVPFSTFISADNYYQGYLHTKEDSLLRQLTMLLYPEVKPRHLETPHLINTFYWFMSLKQYLARLFPYFLKSVPSGSENLLGYTPPIGEMLRTAMDAQIRALTGGDITKEQAVLSMDTWRALTELNAKAREAEEIRSQTK